MMPSFKEGGERPLGRDITHVHSSPLYGAKLTPGLVQMLELTELSKYRGRGPIIRGFNFFSSFCEKTLAKKIR